MDFVCFTVPRDTFPRFDNACTKSLELQSRFNILLSKPKDKIAQQENKYVKVYLCKERNETEFPVEINSVITETITDPRFGRGKIINSRNINSFLKSQTENDNTISLLVVDSKYKKEFNKLVQTNFRIIVVAGDNHVKTELEIKLQGQSISKITVAEKEIVAREIDNVLERISLAPLKQVCENCYDMLKLKSSSTETSTGFPYAELSNISETGNKYKQVDTSNRSPRAETSTSRRNGYLPEHIATEKKPRLALAQSYSLENNGCTVRGNFDEFLEKQTPNKSKYVNKESEANKKDVSSHVWTTVYTRSKNVGSASVFKDFNDTVPITTSLGRKETKGLAGKRTAETDTGSTSKVKRRKTELSDKNGISDTNYHCASGGQMQEEENPERLLEAILALYGMSNVPETERPNVPKHSYKVSKEMRKELFKISPSIKRMGYRYRTFYIYAVKPKSKADEESRKEQICSVLNKYGICQFEIAPCAEHVTEFMHVGAEIEARSPSYSLRSRRVSGHEIVKGGTFGCFVSMNDEEGQCGLLSKHVSEHCSGIYYVAEENDKWLGHMIEATNTHQPNSLDISAAKIDELIGEEGTKFMDTRQTLLKGKLYEYTEDEEDAICKSGQTVHIYGAKSKPGKGEITMPFVDSGLSTTLIQVEDQVNNDGTPLGRFAEKGDSGAIVCVEDPNRKNVHALSMVMGTQDLEDSSSTRRTYLTIPLSKGLQQLESDTGKHFKLC